MDRHNGRSPTAMEPGLTGEPLSWRANYASHLVAKGLATQVAADLAVKVRYRAGLIPTDTVTAALPPLIDVSADAELPGSPESNTRRKVGHDDRIAKIGAEIAGEAPTGAVMAFTHSIFCQVGLPRRAVPGDVFLRRSGNAWLHVQAGFLDEGAGPIMQPIPYGVMPRLALAWISTYSLRHNTREIPLGDSPRDFLRRLGLGDQGHRYKMLRRQIHALAACRLQLGLSGRTFNGQPVEQFDAWVQSGKDCRQRTLWPGLMFLSESYAESLGVSGVPLDNRALLGLTGSALALDIYVWLAHRLHRISGRPVVLHWASLRVQFAQEYGGKDPNKDFKREFVPALRAALTVYPAAKVKIVKGGILLAKSAPPVSYRSQQ